MSFEDAIKVENLSKCYHIYEKPRDRLLQMLARGRRQYFREFWALKDVSFEVKKGETIGIVGRNGSGKSTLLQMICGTLSPTSGNIETEGRIAALLELGSGFNPEFSGRENVYMNAAIMGLSRDEVDAKYEEILTFADIGDFINQPVKTYSSGMLVRLAFSVAAQVDPDILIVDEALSVGDIRFQLKCHRKFEEFREQGKTIFFVSHSTSDVVRLCNRAIWLDYGMVRRLGLSKIVVEEYHAHMVHDTQLQQSVSAKKISLKSVEQVYDLVTVPGNACITGEGGAVVEAVGFFTEDNKRISLLNCTQKVKIVFRVSIKEEILNPFFAFQIINSKGLRVLSNSNLVLGEKLLPINSGSIVEVCFSFVFPEIENGPYVIAIGVNDGTIEMHIRHQYILDAYEFQYLSTSIFQKQSGLIKLKDCLMTLEELS